MNDELDIRVDWMSGGDQPLADPAAAWIAIVAGGINLCRAENRWSRSVVEAAPLSATPLAWWFANSWWRLRCEPAPPSGSPSTAWRMAHELGAAGAGFVWPPIRLVSDGETIEIEARPFETSDEVLRYLTRAKRRVPMAGFDAAVDAFVALTIERLSTDAGGQALAALWRQVRGEREDPEAAAYRRLEALLGFDPDDAPPDLVDAIRTLASGDPGTQGELAAIGAEAPLAAIRETLDAAQSRGDPATSTPLHVFFAAHEPAGPASGNVSPGARVLAEAKLHALVVDAHRPFERGYQLAHAVRSHATFGPMAPIESGELGDELGLGGGALEAADARPTAPFAVAIRETEGTRFLFRSPHRIGRRFEAARMLGDRLAYRDARLHPVAATGTARQAMQRAFAAELLAPHAAIMAMMGNDRSPEAQADAAEHFGVGELTIRHQLANHGSGGRDPWSAWP